MALAPVLRYTKQSHFMSVLVAFQLSKLFIIVFWNVHVFCNVELRDKHFEKPASMLSMPQLVVTNT